MKVFIRLVLVLFSTILVCSCTATKWSYEKDAIRLHITGDPELNLYQKKAHTLILCTYHLKDLNGFNQLVDEKGGLEKLLECNRFDQSVTHSKRLVVQPNQDLTEPMNRTEDAKYLGIVAGYYSLKKDQSTRLFQIPVSWTNSPKKLYVTLHMGPQGIQERKENQ
ncbi:MAG: type VI secretion system lipoprotein TssJ [Desulfuromonadales bacterium]|nr:type VI secretion system lipoprotein TssJ [Desulfuromonadales bacterium]